MKAASVAVVWCVFLGGFGVLRTENRNVRDGNERLAAGDAKGALGAYDRAARELPSEGGVHLDRGLALLRDGQLGPARDALHLANQQGASAEVRAGAAYNLGIAFYKEADGLAGENKHDEAQKAFREAADAFKQALRARPGERDAAFNYELAKRRIVEQQEKQKQEQDKKDQEQKKDDEQKKQDDANKDNAQNDKDQKPSGDDGKKPQDEAKKDEPKKDGEQQAKQDQPKPQDGASEPQQAPEQAAQRDVPKDVTQALDALENGEQNLERMRAANRAARERRKPEKDW